MTWENYPVRGDDRIPPYDALEMDFEPPPDRSWVTVETGGWPTPHADRINAGIWLAAAALWVYVIVATIAH